MGYSLSEMASFLNYQSNAAEAPVMRKWVLLALILSIAFHCGLYYWFKSTDLPHFSSATDRLVPRTFNVNHLTIDQKLLEETEENTPTPVVKTPVKNVPNLKPAPPKFETLIKEVRTTPDSVEPSQTILNEKPHVDSSTLKTVSKLQESAAKRMEHEMDAFKDQLLNDKPAVNSAPALNLTENIAQKNPESNKNSTALEAADGRLDQLLGNGLHVSDAPLQLPGGALFDFDKVDLNPVSLKLLEKVAELVQKNPKVTFEIEGYTDSFGSPEHNLELSAHRAESVKTGILKILADHKIQIDPAHIQAKGFGSSHYRLEPNPVTTGGQAAIDAEIARQQPNRRVEIVFRFPPAPAPAGE